MFLTVLYYCILIIFLPVVSFFSSKYLLSNFDISSTSQNIYAAVVAVIALHLALAIYLVKGNKLTLIVILTNFNYFILAYSSGDKPKQVVKQD